MKKKKILPRTAGILKNIINVRAWFDWERIKAFNVYLKTSLSKFFLPDPKQASESFEAAKTRLNLSDKDLQKKQKALFRLSILMIFVALLFLIYSIYTAYLGHIMAFLISLVVMLISLTLAFRYHFWYFQIKKRKLGCSVSEWFKNLMGEKP